MFLRIFDIYTIRTLMFKTEKFNSEKINIWFKEFLGKTRTNI